VLDNDLGNEPRVDEPVVRVHEDPLTACCFAPLRDLDDLAKVHPRLRVV